MKILKIVIGRIGTRLPVLLYADDLVLYGKSEEGLKGMKGIFVEVCKRRSQNLTENKSNEVV